MSKRRNRQNRKRIRNWTRTTGPYHPPEVKALRKAVVDIVVPVYGGGQFVVDCVKTLYEHDAGVPFSLVLVDDQSPADPQLEVALEYAQEMGAHVHRRLSNGGFAATCNTGAGLGRSPWILLLNSDTRILHDGWLKAMVDEGEDPKVGVVGALLTFYQSAQPWAPANQRIRPAGKVQHAGVVFDILRRPYHIFNGWDPDHPKVAQRREMNCVTGACLLTRRHLWDRIGGLSPEYTRGNFEDVEYCLLARINGYKVVWTPAAHLEHYAGGSGNSMTAKRNAEVFQLRMGEFVVYDEWEHW